MINNKKVLVIIPARGGSKGLPGKNIRNMHGLPLIGWPIKAALNAAYVDKVIVSTDDEAIAAVARTQGAKVPFIRPAEFASDQASSAMVVNHALDFLAAQGENYDYLVLLEPTSPLTESADVDRALEMLDGSAFDAIVGVSLAESVHPNFCATIKPEGNLTPFGGGSFAAPTRRQDLEDLYFFEGSLYISKVSTYKDQCTFYHDKTLPYIVPKWKSFEIDTLVDFICVESIMKNLHQLSQ